MKMFMSSWTSYSTTPKQTTKQKNIPCWTWLSLFNLIKNVWKQNILYKLLTFTIVDKNVTSPPAFSLVPEGITFPDPFMLNGSSSSLSSRVNAPRPPAPSASSHVCSGQMVIQSICSNIRGYHCAGMCVCADCLQAGCPANTLHVCCVCISGKHEPWQVDSEQMTKQLEPPCLHHVIVWLANLFLCLFVFIF